MSKPILRVGKIKKTGRSTPESVHAEHCRSSKPHNADPAKIADNRWLMMPKTDLRSAIRQRIENAGIDYEKTRKDAVIANDMILSISPEFFRPDDPEAHGKYDAKRLEAFRKAAVDFIKDELTDVVSVVLHLDEATPHIQIVAVPIIGDRLSAKEAYGPARLGELQQAWEDKLRPLGVGPRTVGSRARHTTLKEYYSSVSHADTQKPGSKISDPPLRGRLESDTKYQEKLKAWKADENKKRRKELLPILKEAAKGRLHEAERLSGIETRAELSQRSESFYKALDELELTKAQIDQLRKSNVNQVAAAIGYVGKIGKRENAIDLLKRVEKLTYQQACGWLYQKFGKDAVEAEGIAYAAKKAASSPQVVTASEAKKMQVIEQQLTVLDAPKYRVTVMTNRDGEQIGRNLGKSKENEVFFTKEQIKAMIPSLTAHNARGGNIFITPIDEHMRHVLIDDLTEDTLAELKKRGYAPALVQETSPGSIQAVIKIPASLSKTAANEWFKDLNRDLGDEKITGLIHPFRLAGFMNMKPKHAEADAGRPPFVRIIEATNVICAKAVATVKHYIVKKATIKTLKDSIEPKGRRPF